MELHKQQQATADVVAVTALLGLPRRRHLCTCWPSARQPASQPAMYTMVVMVHAYCLPGGVLDACAVLASQGWWSLGSKERGPHMLWCCLMRVAFCSPPQAVYQCCCMQLLATSSRSDAYIHSHTRTCSAGSVPWLSVAFLLQPYNNSSPVLFVSNRQPPTAEVHT